MDLSFYAIFFWEGPGMTYNPIRVRFLVTALLGLAVPIAASAQGASRDTTSKKRKGVDTTASQSLPGVEVTATNDTPAAGVLQQSDIGRFDGVSLVDPINTIPGVFMQTRTPFGGARITLRGYYPSTSGNSPNSNGLGYNVFLNGIPITDATGTTILDDIDYSTLGSVEVIKGPNSSRYGSYIGGTVNLTTARPTADQNSLSQQLLSGTDGMLSTNTTLSHSKDGSDWVLNYGHQGYNGFRPNDFSGKEYLSALGDFKASSNQMISTFFSYNRSNEGLAGEIDSTNFYNRQAVSDANYLANNSHIAVTSYFAGVSDRYQVNDQFSNQTSVFASGRVEAQPFAHGFTDVDQVNFGARSVFDWSGQWGTVGVQGALGGTIQQSNFTSNGVFITPAPPYPERPSDTENFAVNSSVFTEWTFNFPGMWAATVGGSVNSDDFATRNLLKSSILFDTTTLAQKSFGNVFDPRASLSKTFSNGMLVFADVSTGFAPPLLSQVIANNGTVDLGLKPESATQYEAGVQGSWFARRLSSQLTWFDLDNTNKLVSQTVSSVTSTVNVGEQRNQGVEFALSWLAVGNNDQWLTQLRPWVTYTYTDAKYVSFLSDDNNNAATVSYSGNQVARVPKTMYNIGLDADTHSGFYIHGTYQFVDKVPVTFDNSTWMKSYDILSAKIGYAAKITGHYLLDLSFGGTNLTNSTYYTAIFVGPNYKGLAQGPDGGTGDGYILPAPYGAQYFANVKLTYVF
jgi:iron complex outermembrane receptor protein